MAFGGAARRMAVLLMVLAGPAVAQDAGKQVYEKANCVGCHKWHGGGGGGYGGAALSLCESGLDRQGLVDAVRCGRPATRMARHRPRLLRHDPL